EFEHCFAVTGAGLEVQQIARVYHSLRANRQTEAWQILRDLNAERRIVNRQTTGKRINREHSRLRRKSEHGLDVRPCRPVAGNLQGGALEETVAKERGRVGQPVGRKLLSAAE